MEGSGFIAAMNVQVTWGIKLPLKKKMIYLQKMLRYLLITITTMMISHLLGRQF